MGRTTSFLALIALVALGFYVVNYLSRTPSTVTIAGKTYYTWSLYTVNADSVTAFRNLIPQSNAYGTDCLAYVRQFPSVVDWFFDKKKRSCIALQEASENGLDVQKIITVPSGTIIAQCDAKLIASSGSKAVKQHTCIFGGKVWDEDLSYQSAPPFLYPLSPTGVPPGVSLWSQLKTLSS